MRTLLCFLSLHKWKYSDDSNRICNCCNRFEFLDLESDVNAYGNPMWLKK